MESAGPYDTACFHAQQAVEKYLKGLLALHGQACHPTHNLEELQHLGEKSVPGWPLTGMDLAELTSYAVQVRYDFEFWPDYETVQQALKTAREVRTRALAAVPKQARP